MQTNTEDQLAIAASAVVAQIGGIDLLAILVGAGGAWAGLAFTPASIGVWRALALVSASSVFAGGTSELATYGMQQLWPTVPHLPLHVGVSLFIGFFAPQLIPALRDRVPLAVTTIVDWAVGRLTGRGPSDKAQKD